VPVTERTYQSVALEDPERSWELHDGCLMEKPWMGNEHNDIMSYLGFCLIQQLDPREYRVPINGSRLRRSAQSSSIPDVCVIPVSLFRQGLGRPGELEFYSEPLPLIVEIWSPSTGDYDVDENIPE